MRVIWYNIDNEFPSSSHLDWRQASSKVTHKPLVATRYAYPPDRLQELIVVTCCAPADNNNDPVYTNQSAAMLAVSNMAPLIAINWTAAPCKSACQGFGWWLLTNRRLRLRPQKYSKNNNWKKKDYDYVILSIFLSKVQTNPMIPEIYAQAWLRKQSQDFDTHHSRGWAQSNFPYGPPRLPMVPLLFIYDYEHLWFEIEI